MDFIVTVENQEQGENILFFLLSQREINSRYPRRTNYIELHFGNQANKNTVV